MKPFKLILALAAALALGGCQTPGDTFFVRSQDADMPVMVRGNTGSKKLVLFLHGGPGGSAIPMAGLSSFRALEARYGVAYWEQRGAGNAQGNAKPETMTLEQHLADLDRIVDVLKRRHQPDSIYLLAHSWGGTLATAYLLDPERQGKIKAWISSDGAFSMVEGNRLSRDWALKRAQEKVDQGQDVDKWRGILAWYQETPTLNKSNFAQHYRYASDLGAYVYDPKKLERPAVAEMLFFSPHSVASEMANFGYSTETMVENLLTLDYLPKMGAITLPTLVLNGRHDGMVPVGVAEAGYAALGTPASDKALTIFENSAHRPLGEEPEAFADAVIRFVDAH